MTRDAMEEMIEGCSFEEGPDSSNFFLPSVASFVYAAEIQTVKPCPSLAEAVQSVSGLCVLQAP